MGCVSSSEISHTSKIAVTRDSLMVTQATEELELERCKQRYDNSRDSVSLLKTGEFIGAIDNNTSKFSKARDSVQLHKEKAVSSSSNVPILTKPPSFEEAYVSFKALRKGQDLLCRDIFISKYTQQEMARWREAEIVKVKENMITVHFVGMYEVSNAMLNRALDFVHYAHVRIAPYTFFYMLYP